MPVPTLNGQTVVVIGGSAGIGFAVAEGAVADGARVVVGSSDPAKVDAAAKRLGAAASGRIIDVRDETSVASFFGAIEKIDHLVMAAGEPGPLRPSKLTEMDLTTAGDGLQVRFWGALLSIKHALPRFSPSGSITLTDGLIAERPIKGRALATAFIGAIEHLVRGLAVDLAPIRVNTVSPGLVQTDRLAGLTPEMIHQATQMQPIPRAADPSEVAQAYLYLMRGGFTTGQVLLVDGGRLLV